MTKGVGEHFNVIADCSSGTVAETYRNRLCCPINTKIQRGIGLIHALGIPVNGESKYVGKCITGGRVTFGRDLAGSYVSSLNSLRQAYQAQQ